MSKLVHFSKAILLLLLSGILLPAPLLAHGGVGVQHLNNVPAGPFRVYVWSDPEPPQVGEYHVTVALTENIEGDSTGLAGGPVLDAVVTVELTHEESGETLSARATHDDALNKLFYEASFEPAHQGNWSVRVSILPPGCATAQGSSEQQGGDSGLSCESEQVVSFQDEILPKAFPWRALLGGILSILLIMGAVVLYWATKPPTAIEEPAPAKQQDPAPAGGHS
ncbi:MAG: hypothetical protein OXI80_07035 [Caldilineaceae bacterium]|nr:hypothetical protein [Caldilineaceae bacterium]